jgi:hypothetical protein
MVWPVIEPVFFGGEQKELPAIIRTRVFQATRTDKPTVTTDTTIRIEYVTR